ncbi:MAG: methyltransferase domain-containing protein [Caldilineaceae bacterium]
MKKTTLTDICCPLCLNGLELIDTDRQADEIVTGVLQCKSCGSQYPIAKKIPDLLPRKQTEAYKLREMDGWVNLWEKKGMYANPTLEHAFSLPYIGGIWTNVARMFDRALAEMNLTGQEFILDVGAGQGWASRYFAAKGCKVIATDIVADEWYGLGRAWAIMEHAQVYFEPMIADGERLPFPANQFDVVFFCGALHHFVNFDPVLQQMYRVLKPGGRLFAAGEPSIPIFTPESFVQKMLEEVDEGIVERRPKVYEYWRSAKKAGFTKIAIDTYETFEGSPQQIDQWIKETGRHLTKVVRPRYRPIAWSLFHLLPFLPTKMAGQFALYVLGGNLLIRARKPA